MAQYLDLKATCVKSGEPDMAATRESDTNRAVLLGGASAEAEAVAEVLVRDDGMTPPDLRDGSPRIEEAFAWS